MSAWRAIAEAILSEEKVAWLASPLTDKTATTVTTSKQRDPGASFGGFVGFGIAEGDEAERAAIIEYDGGIPREWAEGLARLLSMPPPAGVLPSLWRARIDRAARFCDAWAARARDCGWTASELFGLHPSAPLSRYDAMGAAFLGLEGDVVEVTPVAVLIRQRNGVRQQISKTQNPQPPAWMMGR